MNELVNMKKLLLIVLILVSTILPTSAANYFWIGGTGDWNDTSHWSLTSGGSATTSIPGNTDDVFIDNNSGSTAFTISGNVNISINNLTSTNSNLELNITNQNLTCNNFNITNANQLVFSNSTITLKGTLWYIPTSISVNFTNSPINSTTILPFTFTGGNAVYNNLLFSSNDVVINGSNTFKLLKLTTLTSQIKLENGTTLTVDSLFIMNNCMNHSSLSVTNPMGSNATIAKTGYKNLKLQNVDVNKVNGLVAGGVNYYTENGQITNASGWTLTGRKLFWIGGSGNWTDINHWSLSSGGTANATCIPSYSDSTIFDVNSFSSNNQTVTVDKKSFSSYLDWSDAAFNTVLLLDSNLSVNGDIILNPNLFVTQDSTVNVVEVTGASDIDAQGAIINCNFFIKTNNPSDIVKLNADFKQQDSLGIFFSSGHFDLNNFNLICDFIIVSADITQKVLDFRNSNITLSGEFNAEFAQNFTFNAGNSTLFIGDTLYSSVPKSNSLTADGLLFNKVILDFRKNGNPQRIWGNSTFKELTILKNSDITIDSTMVLTVQNSLNILGNCSDSVFISSSNSTIPASFNLSGATTDILAVNLNNIKALGASPAVIHSNGIGDVSGWFFDPTSTINSIFSLTGGNCLGDTILISNQSTISTNNFNEIVSHWYFNDGSTGYYQHTSPTDSVFINYELDTNKHVFNGKGVYNVVLETINTNNFCTSRDTTIFSVYNPSVLLNSSSLNHVICMGESVQFDAASDTTVLYQYSLNGIPITSFTSDSTLILNNLLDGDTISVRTSFQGCISTDEPKIGFDVNGLPTFDWNVTSLNSVVCDNDSYVFQASILGGGSNYTFQYFKNGSSVKIGDSYTTNQIDDQDVFSLVAKDANNCRDTLSQIFTVLPLPSTSLITSVSDNTICLGDQVDFTASNANKYEFFINGLSQGAASTVNTFSTAGLHSNDVVSVIGYSVDGCLADAPETFSYYVNPLPNINMTYSPASTICSGSQVDFLANGASSYEFFVNGTSVQGPSSMNQFSTNSLNNNDQVYVKGVFSGCPNTSTTTTFTVLNAPITTLTSDAISNTACRNTSIEFTASGALSYEFFVDGVSQGSASANNSFTTSSLLNGQTVRVDGVNGSCVLSKSITMNILPVPSVGIYSSDIDNTICDGENITFTGTNAVEYELYVDNVLHDGPQTSNIFNPTLVAGTHEIFIIGKSANGCTSESNDTITFVVNSIPTVNLSSSVVNNIICTNDEVILTATGADKFQLFINSIAQGGYSTNPSFNFSNIQNGDSYSVIGNTLGCTSSSNIQTFVVKPKPIMSLTSSLVNNIFCEDVVNTYTATGADNYQFSVNEVPQGGFTPVSTISTNGFIAGNYPLKVVGEQDGCYDSTQVQITINSLPNPSISTSTNSICESENVTYIANGGYLYEFFINGTSQGAATTFDSFTSNTLQNGDVVSVEATTNAGCKNTTTSASIIVYQKPIVTLNNLGSNTICSGDNVVLTSGGATNYQFLMNGISQGSFSSSSTFNSSTIVNGDQIMVIGESYGCVDSSAIITFTVNDYPVVSLINNATDNQLCSGELSDLTAIGATDYLFYINGLAYGTYSPSADFNVALNDGDIVTVTGQLNGCVSAGNQSVDYIVYSYPNLGVTTSAPSAIICKDELVTYNSSGAMTYEYYLNNHIVQSGNTPYYEISSLEENDEIKIIGYNGNCPSSATLYTYIVNSMNLNLTTSPSNMVCDGSPIQFTGFGADEYQFYINGMPQGNFSSNNSFTLNNGNNLDEVTFIGISNTTQCHEQYDNVVTVNMIQQPSITANSPYEFCEGDSVVLYSNSKYGNQWYYNGNPIGNATDSIYVAYLDGDYSLDVTHGGMGEIWSQGNNASGIYGDSSNFNDNYPVKALSSESFKQVVSGQDHVLALTVSGDVYAWGKNNNGQLGDGTYSNKNYPKKVTALSNIKCIATSYQSNVAVTNSGDVYVWGKNDVGQLGTGSNMVINFPYLNPNISAIDTVTGGENHFILLKNDGTVWTMGANTAGQLGNGTVINSLIPIQVASINNMVAIGAGRNNSFAIDNNGQLFAWGANESGQLGLGDLNSRTAPTLNNFKKVKSVVGGSKHSIFLVEGNYIYTAGDNTYGQLGTGDFNNYLLPFKINISGVSSIAAHKNTSLLLKGDNNVFGFGNNEYHQLTADATTSINTIKHLDDVEGVTYISVSEKSSHFIFGVDKSCSLPTAVNVTVHPIQDVEIAITGNNVLSTNVSAPNVSYQWYLNGLPIPGGTNSIYSVTSNGTYSVVVTFEGGCPIESNAIIVDDLKTSELDLQTSIIGYPNPTTGDFQIAFGSSLEGQSIQILIIDELGRILKSQAAVANNYMNLSLENLSAGNYQVIIKGSTFSKILKVLKMD